MEIQDKCLPQFGRIFPENSIRNFPENLKEFSLRTSYSEVTQKVTYEILTIVRQDQMNY